MRYLALVLLALMLAGCFGRSTKVDVECKAPEPQDALLLQPTVMPKPPTDPLGVQVTLTHFNKLYGAIASCNADKRDYLNVYYPELSSDTLPSGD